MPASADLECSGCRRPKGLFDWCRACPYSLDGAFRDLERLHGIRVTPELWAFCRRLLQMEEDLRIFGSAGRRLGRLEREGIKIVQRERSRIEQIELESVRQRSRR